MKRLVKGYWPAIIWSAIIFILLIIPGRDLPEVDLLDGLYIDKLVHFGIFALFVALWCWSISSIHPGRGLKKKFIIVTLAGIVFGYIMELVQKYFTYNRSYDLWDFLAGVLGCLCGLIFSLVVFRKK